MFAEDCEHNFKNNICQKCNLVIENNFDEKYTDTDHIKDNNKYSIIDQLKDIPEEIIRLAKRNIIKKQNETGDKIRNDKKQTFIQVYEASIESGYKIAPTIITKQLGLGKKETNWCIKQVSKTSLVPSVHEEVNKQISIVILSPVTYIHNLCENNNIQAHEKKLIKLTEKILEEKDILFSLKPEYIACGIVKKYCMKEGIVIKSFSKKNGISDNALKKAILDVEEFF